MVILSTSFDNEFERVTDFERTVMKVGSHVRVSLLPICELNCSKYSNCELKFRQKV
jgi:hypothetical protein